VRLGGVDLTRAAGDTVDLAGRFLDGVIAVEAGGLGGGGPIETRQALGPVAWWRLLMPKAVALTPGTAGVVTALVSLLVFLPLGWFGRSWVEAGGAVLPVAAAAAIPAGLALAPAALGYPFASPPAWLAVAAGWTVGWCLRQSIRGVLAATVQSPDQSATHCTSP
jgi:hypothetical protein